MKVRTYKNLHQLTTLPHLFPVNFYIVEGENSLTLIDAGLPISGRGILQFAKQMGKPIAQIVLTHAHDDHIGALGTVLQAFPDAQLCVSAREAALLHGDLSLLPGEHNTPIRGGTKPLPQQKIDVLLQEGDTVNSLTVISLPGHTPGSLGLYSKEHRYIVVGDALIPKGGLRVAGDKYWLFPFPALATWSGSTAIASAQKLLPLELSVLAAGHGPMLQNPKQSIERAIARAKEANYAEK